MNDNKKPSFIFMSICIIFPMFFGFLFLSKISSVVWYYQYTTTKNWPIQLTWSATIIESWNIITWKTETVHNILNPIKDWRIKQTNNERSNKYSDQNQWKEITTINTMTTDKNTVFNKVKLTRFPEYAIAQEYIQFAMDIWQKPLVHKLICENWWFDITLDNWFDVWLCQINKASHPEIVNDPRFFTDWRWHIEQCKKLADQWTAFYWPDRIINGMKCRNYADKFLLEYSN